VLKFPHSRPGRWFVTLIQLISNGILENAISLSSLWCLLHTSLSKVAHVILDFARIDIENSSLDRSNLGNAQTAGLSKDLGLKHNQYNLCLTAYYVAMIVFGPIGSVVSRRVSGKYGISGMLFGFGTASICTAAVKSFPALIICRFFVGVFEAGFVASFVGTKPSSNSKLTNIV
jgi:MFS family permease